MLLRRAKGDAHACRVLADDADIDDTAIGFHAQQAVEKALKIALVLAEVELQRTHDLELLVEQVKASGTEVPGELASVEWLTPWAAELRYDEPTPLDRREPLRTVFRGANAAYRSGLAVLDAPAIEVRGGLSGDLLRCPPSQPAPSRPGRSAACCATSSSSAHPGSAGRSRSSATCSVCLLLAR